MSGITNNTENNKPIQPSSTNSPPPSLASSIAIPKIQQAVLHEAKPYAPLLWGLNEEDKNKVSDLFNTSTASTQNQEKIVNFLSSLLTEDMSPSDRMKIIMGTFNRMSPAMELDYCRYFLHEIRSFIQNMSSAEKAICYLELSKISSVSEFMDEIESFMTVDISPSNKFLLAQCLLKASLNTAILWLSNQDASFKLGPYLNLEEGKEFLESLSYDVKNKSDGERIDFYLSKIRERFDSAKAIQDMMQAEDSSLYPIMMNFARIPSSQQKPFIDFIQDYNLENVLLTFPEITKCLSRLLADKPICEDEIAQLAVYCSAKVYNCLQEKSRFAEIVESLSLAAPKNKDLLFSLIDLISLELSNPDSKTIKYDPTYITSRVEGRFTKQDDYLKRAQKIITIAKHMIQEGKTHDPKDLFFLLLAYLSKERHLIAKDHETVDFSDFGIRRDQMTAFSVLALRESYAKCGEQILFWIRKGLENMIEISEDGSIEVRETTYELETKYMARTSLLFFELLTQDEYKDVITPEDYVTDYLLRTMKIPFSIKESPFFFIKVTSFLNFNEEMVPLTQYNACLPKNPQINPYKSPLKQMNEIGVTLLHQHPDLIQKTLEESAYIFEEIIQLDNLESVQEKMALMIYLLAHNQRDLRGTASETEWLSLAIYAALGLDVEMSDDTLQDLEALSHPLLNEFTDIYKKICKIKS